MARGPLERITARTNQYLDQRNPKRVLNRLLAKLELRWGEIPKGILEDKKIEYGEKIDLLRKVENLKIEHIAPYIEIGGKSKSPFNLGGIFAHEFVERVEPFAWSPFVAKALFLGKDTGHLQREIVDKLTRASLSDALPLLNSQSLQYATLEAFCRKVVDVTWEGSLSIANGDIRRSVYYGPSHLGLTINNFFQEVRKARDSTENRDKTYPDILESLVRPVFNKVTDEFERNDKLKEHSFDEISSNAQMISSVAMSILTRDEQEELRKLNIDITKNLLTVYARYGNKIDYGPVADALVLCTAWFMEKRYSRFFSGTRVLPRSLELIPNVALLDKTGGVEVANIMGNSFDALIKLPTVYLSFSTFRGEMPGVISNGMKGYLSEKNPLCVASRIELEDMRLRENWIREASIEEIVAEHTEKLIALDAKMEEFLKKAETRKRIND